MPPDRLTRGGGVPGRGPPGPHRALVRAPRRRAGGLRAGDQRALVRVQLLPGRPAQPGGHQHRPARPVHQPRSPGGPRGLSGPPHRAQPQGGGPGSPAPPARGDDLPGRHAAVPARRGTGRPGPRGGGRSPPRAHGGRRTSGRSGSPTTPTWSPSRPRPARRWTRCGPTPPSCCTTVALDDSRWWTTWPAGACHRGRGRRRRCRSWPIPPGGRTSSATSRVSRLCRRFVGGDPARFERLITEQLLPDGPAGGLSPQG